MASCCLNRRAKIAGRVNTSNFKFDRRQRIDIFLREFKRCRQAPRFCSCVEVWFAIEQTVSWKNTSNVPIVGQPIRLGFLMKHTDSLHVSFQDEARLMVMQAPSRRSFLGRGLGLGASALSPTGFTVAGQSDDPQQPATDAVKPAFPREMPPREMRAKPRELLGVEPLPKPIPVQREISEKTDHVLLQTNLSFCNLLGETLAAVLLEPPGTARKSLAGVLCMSGTSGGAERITHAEFRRAKQNEGALLGWARELIRRGFVTLSLTLTRTDGRRVGVKFWEKQARMLTQFGRTLMGVMVDEVLRVVSVLRDVDTVDPKQLALTGMSLGGNVSCCAMACVAEIRASAPVCGGVASLLRQILAGHPDRYSSSSYVRQLLRYIDHPQIVLMCICPRPFMTIAPTKIQDMPKSGVDERLRVVEPAYKAVGQSEPFRVYQPDSTLVYP